MNHNKKNFLIWCITIILSIIFLFFGNKIVCKNLNIFQNEIAQAVKGKVITIEDVIENNYTLDNVNIISQKTVLFTCKILSGTEKGQEVLVSQNLDEMLSPNMQEVFLGSKVILYPYENFEFNTDWVFGEFYRFDAIIGFAMIFFILIVIIGGRKGVSTLISLLFTCLAIFMIFIPAVLNGYNIYISGIIVCTYTIITTLVLLNGLHKKTLATILSCFFGVMIAGLITVLMDKFLMLSGFVDEHSIYLQMINPDKPINLKAIIFASIMIGAMGAVMDVAMDISSALFEIREHAKEITLTQLVKSGLSIGRDIMGTMANTLILAYIGSSMSCVLLLTTYSGSLMELLNREQVIVEFLQSLVGSMSILLTIPLTALVCGFLYIKDTSEN